MIIAHLSDLHITAPGTLYQGKIGTARMAGAAVAAVNALAPAPDAVICTGDLTENGSPEEYAAAAAILDRLRAPLFVIPGNHDEREAFRSAFAGAGYLPPTGPLHYAAAAGDLRLVHLDCTVPGRHHGEAGEEGLAWLEDTLAAEPDSKTFVMMHHHPVASGIRDLDAYANLSGPEIAAVLRRHPQVERVLFGHIHRQMTAAFGGTIAMSSPATASQILLRLGPDSKAASRMEPPGFLLHHIQPCGTVASHLQPIGDFGPVMEFF